MILSCASFKDKKTILILKKKYIYLYILYMYIRKMYSKFYSILITQIKKEILSIVYY